ncbi:2TM domain-containing protein [Flavobacterium sp. J372]|uniref:2TM domain-containing protein n=1 Tax=Flavobacterium sp. J372 TaxID=2898436 RepID=UPI002150E292|nr:2TM domain-containing protein [Flavobacterium sp. J372]MCR5862859.1 2TM domain-containing protein [Flavobacterium sp. J372]
MFRRLLKELARSIWIGSAIAIVLILITLAKGKRLSFDGDLAVNIGYILMYTTALHLANTLVFVAMDKLFNNDRMSPKRLAVGFMASFFVSVFVIFLLRIVEDVLIEGESLQRFFAEEDISNYYVAIVITMVVTLLIHAFYFYKKYQENRVKQQKIIAGTASAKFETLKNQIDPHFLFNSLNVLSSLIEENPDAAQRFTTSLSKVYRYVLEQKDKELVSVEEELAFAKTYMNLLRMRFENSITFELPEKIPGDDAKVVPLSLQLLLENTIKHNVVSQQRPLHIKIYLEDGYLVVQNILQKKEVLQDRRGVGLQNIVSRYAIITDRKVLAEETKDHFIVKIPVLTKQLSIMETTGYQTENSYYKAQKRVEEIKGFYGNLFSFILINLGLMILNLVTYPQYLWFLYPVAGWGIGVIIHAMYTFSWMPFFGADWEEKKIREIIEKENSDKWR